MLAIVKVVLIYGNAPSSRAKWKVEQRPQPLFLPVTGGWGDLLLTLLRCVLCKPRSTHSGDFQMALGGCFVLLIFSIINVATMKGVFFEYVHRRNSPQWNCKAMVCECVLHMLCESFCHCRRAAYNVLLEAGREFCSSSIMSGEGHTFLCRQPGSPSAMCLHWYLFPQKCFLLNTNQVFYKHMVFPLLTGIFAYMNYRVPRTRKEIFETLIKGLQRLEYRGYDSAGRLCRLLPYKHNTCSLKKFENFYRKVERKSKGKKISITSTPHQYLCPSCGCLGSGDGRGVMQIFIVLSNYNYAIL